MSEILKNITPEILKKVKEFTLVSVNQHYNNGGGKNNKFIAEEATSDLLLKMARTPEYWNARELTDSLLFVSSKNQVLSTIKKYHQTKKREVWKDSNTIQLEQEMGGFNLEIVDESTEEDEIERIEKEEKEIEQKLNVINQAMNDCEWITEKDKEIFVKHWLEGKKLKEIAKDFDNGKKTISNHTRKIRNILNYLNDEQNRTD